MSSREVLDGLRPAWLEIDLDAIAQNAREIKNYIGSEVELMAVVKANAYGHGAVEVAKTALNNGADRLAVALLKEGKELRLAGIKVPILILSPIYSSQIQELVEYNLTPTIFTLEMAKAISKYGSQIEEEIDIHIKVDTGMGRIGVLTNDAFKLIKEVNKLPYINIEGVFSHLAIADELEGQEYTHQQINRFSDLIKEIKKEGIEVPIRHLANSAATFEYPKSRFDMVRTGISLYGLPPSPEITTELNLQSALEWKAKLAYVKELPPEYSISYGCTYTTTDFTKVGTIPLGYSDGYPRLLSNQGDVLIKGRRRKILGRVCMDQLMIEVTGISDLDLESEVVLIGKSGSDEITVTELASKIGTINYEVVSQISSRVTRIYLKDGEIIKVKE
ncbi:MULTISPECIES: alanine racemase [unclassified Candidatus Frackibacter]|uniref:alanine racemase n=1 Tax=unclassified Candidatus Frackibacter TaxID=2648818 RepID=UPI0007936384|nr:MULTISPECIES: alanine racemase [unclassified Candidatus Frackibacter]KXS40108.1 MAG: alanine racemase [Candidatus Frackibacter sp. T328-2]SDC44186.1 alanine racemase [Candidatus Frackibacter sp. WG11]SEM64397.1 alanine racemase [Candidatus Frackibacter sp. WG12]SFL68244.1 alanine racemase [Candidatus Frackibacter sp. WG13]